MFRIDKVEAYIVVLKHFERIRTIIGRAICKGGRKTQTQVLGFNWPQLLFGKHEPRNVNIE